MKRRRVFATLLEDSDWDDLKAVAAAEERSISAQLSYLIKAFLRGRLRALTPREARLLDHLAKEANDAG